MIKIYRRILFFGMLLPILNAPTYAQEDREESLKPLIQEVAAKLEKSAARRPFRFKGMNDSLQSTSEALKLLDLPETPKAAAPLPVWSSSNPLSPVLRTGGLNKSQKKILHLMDKAGASHPKNSFALAVKAYVLDDAGQDLPAREAWESYLSLSEDYSSFDREILSREQFDAVRHYAKNFLRSRGIDFQKAENERFERLPAYKKLWYLMTHVKPEERKVNRLFLLSLIFGSGLLVLSSFARMEFYRGVVFSLVSFCAAIWLSYGCWIYERAFGLPWDLTSAKVIAVLFGAAVAVSLYEVWMAWHYANPQLEEGYCRCPHCKKIIVQLSVECEYCHKKID